MAEENRDGFDWTQIVADRKIIEAMEEGLFDNLPGKGKPLDLSVNPFETPGMGAINRMLSHNRVLPPWLLLEKEIETAKSTVADTLARWEVRAEGLRDTVDYPRFYAEARAAYEKGMRDVNDLVNKYNSSNPFTHRSALGYIISRRLAEFDAVYEKQDSHD